MLNGSMLNGSMLNGSGTTVEAPPVVPDVVEIVPSAFALWTVGATLDGDDVSGQLSGTVTIEREEGASTLATVTLAVDGAVNPADYYGLQVSLDFKVWNGAAWVAHPRFNGRVVRPRYSLQQRLLICDCSDEMQLAVEALSVAEIDTLTGGLWSEDVFGEPEGRSRWDYAQERMSTQPASLQMDVAGTLGKTLWAAAAPAYLITAGSVLDESMEWEPVDLTDRINTVELSIRYRYDRLRHREQRFIWDHPDGSFCDWRTNTTELPTLGMVADASSAAGYQAIMAGAIWDLVPLSGNYCVPPIAWVNNFPDLLLGADWTSARRWNQAVTETYSVTIASPSSAAAVGEVIRRASAAVQVEAAQESAETFDGPPAGSVQDSTGDWVLATTDQPRLDSAFEVVASAARAQIIGAHRQNRLRFTMPTHDVTGVLLSHTLDVRDTVASRDIRAVSKVASIIDTWDFDSGEAVTEIALAVSQGGAQITEDPFVLPSAPNTAPSGSEGLTIILPTQLSDGVGSPAHDPDLLGFSGNYDNFAPGPEPYPRRFDIESPEILADSQDEAAGEATQVYNINVPTDILEL